MNLITKIMFIALSFSLCAISASALVLVEQSYLPADSKTVAVLTSEVRLQSLLETALDTGNLIAFLGFKLAHPPTPRGGTWAVDVYSIDGVILYNMK